MYQNNGPNSKGRKWEWDITKPNAWHLPDNNVKNINTLLNQNMYNYNNKYNSKNKKRKENE